MSNALSDQDFGVQQRQTRRRFYDPVAFRGTCVICWRDFSPKDPRHMACSRCYGVMTALEGLKRDSPAAYQAFIQSLR